ncbi:MAG TPA: GNAT family N-acetyltransferase [bacterium]|nr:GNAT family N-acetyltransferase [bacterium]
MAGRSDRVLIEDYSPAADNEPCMALERSAPQGKSRRLSFRRSTFHRRAENFADHKLIVARLEGAVVGVVGVAFKDVRLYGEPRRAAFYFDLRVHPEYRRLGVAWRLAREITRFGDARSDFGYGYTIDDNREARAMAWFRARTPASSCHFLAYPTYARRPSRSEARAASMAEVHERLLATVPPFDFYTNPLVGGSTGGHVASWVLDDAGCTVWSNEGIFAEVVEALPPGGMLAGRMLDSRLLRGLPHPHIPRVGEQIRSWYLTDVHGRNPMQVADLIRFVSARARDQGIDFLHIPLLAGDEWAAAVRHDVPLSFARQLRYLLFATANGRSLPAMRRFYLDIRDI